VDFASSPALDESRRSLLQEVESLKHRRNQATEEIATLKKAGRDASSLTGEMKEISQRIKTLDTDLAKVQEQFDHFLSMVPNVPTTACPWADPKPTIPEVRRWGDKPEFSFAPKAHWDIGEELGILDFARAAKISGARFALYRGLGARLERALINFMLDLHVNRHGYTELFPPFIVNQESMYGTGQLPKFEEDAFRIQGLNSYLIPTAEVPVTNIHRDEVLDEKQLPLRYAAYSACFRAEAGSYGKDTRGLIRQHQFNKVELVHFTLPERSFEDLETLLSHAERILQELGIHYRVVSLCTGDLGFSAAKTYDIEVWLPAQDAYREISSCSNFTTFQARRASIRYRPEGKKKTELIHTLNGSGLAVGRTLVAVLENFQQEDGSVLIPEKLRPYMGMVERITA
jgi:seryl-tRNA synthetase